MFNISVLALNKCLIEQIVAGKLSGKLPVRSHINEFWPEPMRGKCKKKTCTAKLQVLTQTLWKWLKEPERIKHPYLHVSATCIHPPTPPLWPRFLPVWCPFASDQSRRCEADPELSLFSHQRPSHSFSFFPSPSVFLLRSFLGTAGCTKTGDRCCCCCCRDFSSFSFYKCGQFFFPTSILRCALSTASESVWNHSSEMSVTSWRGVHQCFLKWQGEPLAGSLVRPVVGRGGTEIFFFFFSPQGPSVVLGE